MDRQKGCRFVKFTFFAIMIFAILPLLVFPLYSVGHHKIHNSPKIEGGVLDLNGYDLNADWSIPLDGLWEFYYDRFIVSDGLHNAVPDLFAEVPMSWNRYPNMKLHKQGKGSYRIVLKNCPENVELLCYIPSINSSYRVYLNETLIASQREANAADHSTFSKNLEKTDKLYRKGISVPKGKDAILVVEILSPYIGGMYMTPILTVQGKDHFYSDVRNMFASAFMGIIISAIGYIACLLAMRDKLFSSLALLIMDLLVFVRILFQNDYVSFIKDIIPIRDYITNTFLQIITLFLPVVFLFCARKIVQIQIDNKRILFIAVYEVIFAPFIFWLALNGFPGLTLIFFIISYIPFIYVMHVIYQSVKQKVPHSLAVSAILMLVLSCMIASSLSNSGWLVMNIDLFSPACFTLSMILQLWIFIRRSIEIQQQAVEAENLRLKLRESEVNLRLSQIKPHFLYNTLLAIHVLCTEDPETAAETTLKFSSFLRTNMNFISCKELIPFEKEWEHIQNYTDIEKLRYQKRLTICYDIQVVDFYIPPLSIQPLVENAIKHGACKNVKGGTVIVKTYESGFCDIIEIKDDGPGFDAGILGQVSPSGEHYGLQNIIFRLKEQRNAEIEIDSQQDKGTLIRVILPKEGHNENTAFR